MALQGVVKETPKRPSALLRGAVADCSPGGHHPTCTACPQQLRVAQWWHSLCPGWHGTGCSSAVRMDKGALANGGTRSTASKQQRLMGLQLLMTPAVRSIWEKQVVFSGISVGWTPVHTSSSEGDAGPPDALVQICLFGGLHLPPSGQACLPRGSSVPPFPHSCKPTKTARSDPAGGCRQARHVPPCARVMLLMGGCNALWPYRRAPARAPRAGAGKR